MSFVNRTIDDQNGDSVTGQQVSYSPSERWSQGNGCGGCSTKLDASQTVQQTWHDGSRNPSRDPPITVSFKFTGTAVYLFNILSRGDLTDVSISIDGSFVSRYTNKADLSTQFEYNVPVFAANNLAFGEHSVEMTADGPDQTLVLFDYALYTTTQSGNPPSSPPPTTTNPTNTNTAEHSTSSSAAQRAASNAPAASSTGGESSLTTSLPSPSASASSQADSHSLSVSLSVLSQTSTVTVNGQVIQLQPSGTSTGSSNVSPFLLPTQALGDGASHSSHTNVGAIVGGVLGGLALLLACLFAFILHRRRKSRITPFKPQSRKAALPVQRADSGRSEKSGTFVGYSDQRKGSPPAFSSEVSLLQATTYAEPADSESVVSHLELSQPAPIPASPSEVILQRELQSLRDRLAEARASKSATSTTAISTAPPPSRAPKSSSSVSSVDERDQPPSAAPVGPTSTSGEELQRLRAEIEQLRAQQQQQHSQPSLAYASGPPSSSTLAVSPSTSSIVARSPVEMELMRQIGMLRDEMERMRMQQEEFGGLGGEALPSYSPPSRPIPGYNAPPV